MSLRVPETPALTGADPKIKPSLIRVLTEYAIEINRTMPQDQVLAFTWFMTVGAEFEAPDAQESPTSTISILTTSKNLITNGNFNVWQRGDSIDVLNDAATPASTADRWRANSIGAVVFDIDRETATLPDGTIDSAMSLDVTTADASLAAADHTIITQTIEGFDCIPLAFGTADAKPVIVSFWAYSTVTGTYSVNLRNSGLSRTRFSEYSIDVANTWEKKVLSFPGDTTGTWLTDSGIGIQIAFAIALGSTYHGTADTWTAGLAVGSSSGANGVSNAANFFKIAQVQLFAGTEDQPFVQEDHALTLTECHRHYRHWNAVAFMPIAAGFNTSTTQSLNVIDTRGMRATPTLEVNAAADFSIRDTGGENAVTALTLPSNSSPDAVQINATAASVNDGDGSLLRFDSTGVGFFALNAELT